jgi:hypothetical protein
LKAHSGHWIVNICLAVWLLCKFDLRLKYIAVRNDTLHTLNYAEKECTAAAKFPRMIVTAIRHLKEVSSLSRQIWDCSDGRRTMLSTSFLLVLLLIFACTLFLQRRPKATKPTKNAVDKNVGVAHAEAQLAARPARLRQPHKLVSTFATLVDQDGAGTWPPKADHSSWPVALRPYKEVYLEMVPFLAAATPSLDDDVNRERRHAFRSSMQKLLAERVNQALIKSILQQVEAGNLEILPRDQINGFYCAVAVCRHAYRYRLSP